METVRSFERGLELLVDQQLESDVVPALVATAEAISSLLIDNRP